MKLNHLLIHKAVLRGSNWNSSMELSSNFYLFYRMIMLKDLELQVYSFIKFVRKQSVPKTHY
jgi:hypothetical protein